MEWIFIIGCWILWPILCYNIAKDKGRDTNLAILGGIVFGLFSVIYYVVISKVEK
jgi:hypothetical protein